MLKNSQGFTMIEALIAMLVLTVGILALNSMQMTGIKGNSSAIKMTTAGSTAGNSYELLLSLPYNDAALDPAGNPHNQAELAGLVIPAGVNSITWNVNEWSNIDGIDNDGDGDTDENDERNIKLVTIDVNYTSRSTKILTINFLKSELF